MAIHNFRVSVGDHVFIAGIDEEIGAVRQVARDHVIIYVENSGDFEIRGPVVKWSHDGKLVLDPTKLDAALLAAAERAHAGETD